MIFFYNMADATNPLKYLVFHLKDGYRIFLLWAFDWDSPFRLTLSMMQGTVSSSCPHAHRDGERNQCRIRLTSQGKEHFIPPQTKFASFSKLWKFYTVLGGDRGSDLYVFGPAGSASGSVGHKYGSVSGSFHHQAKIVRKTLISTVL